MKFKSNSVELLKAAHGAKEQHVTVKHKPNQA